MRCFIAVELTDYIVNNICSLQKQLKNELWGRDKGVKWVKPENIHITIKFLGDIEDSKINAVCKSCDQAVAEFNPFDIEIGNVGTFPANGGAARVVWAGISGDMKPLNDLFNSVENKLDKLDIPKEGRRFNPHATIARIKLAETGRNVTEIVSNLEMLPFGLQTVDALTIFSSTLDNEGPGYHVIHRSML